MNLNILSLNASFLCTRGLQRDLYGGIKAKEVFRTCNVLPFSCTHLALWRGKGKVKDPRYMQNKKDSRISLFKPGYFI